MSGSARESGRLTASLITATVTLASLLFAIGLGIFLVRGGSARPFQVGGMAQLFSHALRGISTGQARGFIEAGLIVLLLGPLLRLGAAVLRSIYDRDWRFAAIGLAVAVLLLTGILLGTGG